MALLVWYDIARTIEDVFIAARKKYSRDCVSFVTPGELFGDGIGQIYYAIIYHTFVNSTPTLTIIFV